MFCRSILVFCVVGLAVLVGCSKQGGQTELGSGKPQIGSRTLAQDSYSVQPEQPSSSGPQAPLPPSETGSQPRGSQTPATPSGGAPAFPGLTPAQPQNAMAAEDPFTVPDGPPSELLNYLEKLRDARPAGDDFASIQEFRHKLASTLVTVANKVLAQANVATPEEMQIGVRLKMVGLTILSDLGDQQAQTELAGLPDQLEKEGKTELADVARGFALERRVDQAAELEEADLLQLAADVKAFLSSGPVETEKALLAFKLCQVLESRELSELAALNYEELGKLLEGSQDPQAKRIGTLMLGTSRRMKLVGNPLEVTGVTLEGQSLDWSQYKDKVVLVTFWATWCAPCRAEIPGILKNYQAYHDRGFEVVAISVDRERQDLVDFLGQNPLPWTVLFDEASSEKMADKLGIFSIPQMFLVGRDGKVLATDVRGPRLDQHLEELFGPAEKPVTAPVQPAAPATAPPTVNE